ncbi:MAG TPA: GxxExxY protein [Flavipsychrobacter sp.]|nr:GxxExxY protein [Flavipsychrobacter sp.]
MSEAYKHSDLTEKIIQAFYKVYNMLGYGFLEKVYEKAMVLELHKNGMGAANQLPVDVYYDGEKVGLYFADIIVDGKVIVELKAGEGVIEEHEAQLTNYLRATDIEVGLLLGFCKKPIVKRKVFSNEYKTALVSYHGLS